MTIDFCRLKRYYFDMKTRRLFAGAIWKGEAAMSICTAKSIKNIVNTGRRVVSAYSYFSFTKVCYAGRYFAVSNSSDRCDRSEKFF